VCRSRERERTRLSLFTNTGCAGVEVEPKAMATGRTGPGRREVLAVLFRVGAGGTGTPPAPALWSLREDTDAGTTHWRARVVVAARPGQGHRPAFTCVSTLQVRTRPFGKKTASCAAVLKVNSSRSLKTGQEFLSLYCTEPCAPQRYLYFSVFRTTRSWSTSAMDNSGLPDFPTMVMSA
jgi:hypothetical protein